MSEEIEDTYNRHDLECPYCHHMHKDAWEMSPNDEDGETECEACGKEFIWSRYTSTSYTGKAKKS